MPPSRATLATALVAVLGLSWWWTHRPSTVRPPPSLALAGSPVAEPSVGPGLADDAPLPPGAPPNGPPPVIDKAKRDEMRTLIWKAFGETPPPSPATPKKRYVLPEHGDMWTGSEGIASDAEPGIEPEYVRSSVRAQFFPIAQKCYGDALGKSPNLQGEIDLWFVIVGDAKVGGIVESVDVLNKSTLRDPDVVECLRESFLGVTFPPPKGGGVVTVEYPIVFSPDDDDAGAKH
jgi:hypothetical protein